MSIRVKTAKLTLEVDTQEELDIVLHSLGVLEYRIEGTPREEVALADICESFSNVHKSFLTRWAGHLKFAREHFKYGEIKDRPRLAFKSREIKSCLTSTYSLCLVEGNQGSRRILKSGIKLFTESEAHSVATQIHQRLGYCLPVWITNPNRSMERV